MLASKGEEVYMYSHLDFIVFFTKNKDCKLKKVLHDLKQSPRAWFDRFTKDKKKIR